MGLELNTAQIAEMMNVTKAAVDAWRNRDMPCVKKGNRFYYDALEVVLWHSENINSKTISTITDDEMSVEDQLRVKRMEKLDLEMAIQRGEYIPIDEVDDTTASLVALLINQYRQLHRTLPNLLAKKTQSQIKKSLDLEFEKSIEQLNKAYEGKEDAYRE